jgi:hypothetical protein
MHFSMLWVRLGYLRHAVGVMGTRKGQMACATSLLGIIEDTHAEAIHFGTSGHPAKLSSRKGSTCMLSLSLPLPLTAT